jgi:hypothetical protein
MIPHLSDSSTASKRIRRNYSVNNSRKFPSCLIRLPATHNLDKRYLGPVTFNFDAFPFGGRSPTRAILITPRVCRCL